MIHYALEFEYVRTLTLIMWIDILGADTLLGSSKDE